MSRIGKRVLSIPENVNVNVENNVVTVKGPKGELTLDLVKGINVKVEDNKVKSVNFIGGCNGNLKGISSLVEGMNIDDVINKLEGTSCGFKSTSCPDQFAKALKEYKTN